MIAVFFFHAAHIFDLDPGASVKNRDTSVVLSAYAYFADQWIMHIIFLVAGASAWFSLGTRTRSSFLRERAARLMVPFLLGTLLLIPWHGYLSAQNHGVFHGSYPAYLPVHFSGIWSALLRSPLPLNPTLPFVTSWHLWFLGDLFAFSVLAALCFGATAPRQPLWLSLNGAWRLAALGLPVIAIRLIFDARFSSHTDWSETLIWFLLFGYGWLFMKDRTLLRDSASQAAGWLIAGLACVGLLGLAFWKGLLMRWLGQPSYTWDYELYQILAGVNTWAWVLAVTGFSMRRWNFDHRCLGYLGPASLPFYILHQTAILTLGFLVVQTRWALAVKFLVIVAGSLLATAIIYELLIRRSAILRAAFGMRATAYRTASPFSNENPATVPSSAPRISSRHT